FAIELATPLAAIFWMEQDVAKRKMRSASAVSGWAGLGRRLIDIPGGAARWRPFRVRSLLGSVRRTLARRAGAVKPRGGSGAARLHAGRRLRVPVGDALVRRGHVEQRGLGERWSHELEPDRHVALAEAAGDRDRGQPAGITVGAHAIRAGQRLLQVGLDRR